MKVNSLHGVLPYVQQAQDQLGQFHPTAAFVVATLSAGGEVLGLQTQTTYTDTLQEGAMWAEWLTFCVKVGRPACCDTLIASGRAPVTQGPRRLCLCTDTCLCVCLWCRPGRLLPTAALRETEQASRQAHHLKLPAHPTPRGRLTPHLCSLCRMPTPPCHLSLPPLPPPTQTHPHTHTAVPRPAL